MELIVLDTSLKMLSVLDTFESLIWTERYSAYGDFEVYTNMELVQITKMGEEYWFILRDVPENELAFIKLQSDIEYIAMMSEIEL